MKNIAAKSMLSLSPSDFPFSFYDCQKINHKHQLQFRCKSINVSAAWKFTLFSKLNAYRRKKVSVENLGHFHEDPDPAVLKYFVQKFRDLNSHKVLHSSCITILKTWAEFVIFILISLEGSDLDSQQWLESHGLISPTHAQINQFLLYYMHEALE